jgi:hypothetical protein
VRRLKSVHVATESLVVGTWGTGTPHTFALRQQVVVYHDNSDSQQRHDSEVAVIIRYSRHYILYEVIGLITSIETRREH